MCVIFAGFIRFLVIGAKFIVPIEKAFIDGFGFVCRDKNQRRERCVAIVIDELVFLWVTLQRSATCVLFGEFTIDTEPISCKIYLRNTQDGLIACARTGHWD